MKNALLCTLLFCSVAQAHEPYVAPLAYHTENTQIPVLSAYAEQAFHPEYALKDISFSIFQPNQTQTTIQAQKHLESATAFDLKLPEKGTYTIFALYTTNFTELLSYQASAFLKLPEFP